MSIHDCNTESTLYKNFGASVRIGLNKSHKNICDLLKNSSHDIRGDIKPPYNTVIGPLNRASLLPDNKHLETKDLHQEMRNNLKSDFQTFIPALGSGTLVGIQPKNEYNEIIDKTQIFFDILCNMTITQDNYNKLVLLNQEDDTLIPVIKMSDEYMDIIKEWYDMSEMILDIEETDIKIPSNINKFELDNLLFKPFPLHKKDNFIKDYVPKYILKLILDKTLKQNTYFSGSTYDAGNKSLKISLATIGIDNIIFNNKKKNTENILKSFNDTDIDIEDTTEIDDSEDKIVYASNYYDMKLNANYEMDKPYENPYVNLTVILNYYNLNTIVVKEINDKQNEIINNYTEYGFIKLFDILTNNELVKGFIHNTYANNKFNDKDEIIKLLGVTSDFIKIYNKLDKENSKVLDEQTQIKNYLETNFIIDDDINNRIKFTELLSLIENSPLIDIDKMKLKGLRNRLPNYLKNLGLNKKRYNDGYYYYGIKSKYSQEKTTQTLYSECKNERLQL